MSWYSCSAQCWSAPPLTNGPSKVPSSAYTRSLRHGLYCWHSRLTVDLVTSQRTQLVFTGIDVVMLTGFQLLSDGGYVPLLVMGLLPILIGLEVPLRRTAVVLAFTVAGFAFSVRQDPVMDVQLGWPDKFFLFAIYAFVCCTAVFAVYVGERYADAIAGLTALGEELLAQTMTASEALQREVSRVTSRRTAPGCVGGTPGAFELAERTTGEELDHALASLKDAIDATSGSDFRASSGRSRSGGRGRRC